MSEYGLQFDKAIAGLTYGESFIRGTSVVKEVNGISYGLPVFGYEGNEKDIYAYHNNRAQIVFDADFASGDVIDITVDGAVVDPVTFATSHANTMDLLKAQIEADIPGAVAELTDEAGDNRTITITIEDGNDRVVTESVAGGNEPTGTITYDSTMVFDGFSKFTHKEGAVKKNQDGEVVVPSTAKYQKTDAINVVVNGNVWVESVGTIDSKKAVYVVASGDDQGKITQTASGNVLLSDVLADQHDSGLNLAGVRITK